MTKDEIETKQPEQPAPAQETPKAPDAQQVTSDATIDFSVGWGIHAGETRELPEDPEIQKVILANHHIKLIK